MKKHRHFLSLLSLNLALAAFFLAPLKTSAQTLGTTSYCHVAVQPQIEVFSIIDYLGRGKRDLSIASDYKTAVEQHFRPYENHPAVKYWQTLQKKHNLLPGEAGSRFSVADGRFLPLAAPATRNLTNAEWEELEKLVNGFAAKTGYFGFHKNSQPHYARWEQNLQEAIDKGGFYYTLTAFTGTEKNFSLHPDALDAWGAYQVPGQPNGLLVWGYCKSQNSGPDQPPFFADSAMLHNTLWHEMAHTFINPLVLQQAAALKNMPATDKVRRNASRYYELTREVAVSELLVRGMVASLARKHFGDKAADHEIERQLRTFGYDIAETERLFSQQYLKNRTQYPTLESFFPVLLSQFDNTLGKK